MEVNVRFLGGAHTSDFNIPESPIYVKIMPNLFIEALKCRNGALVIIVRLRD